ncbi:hypothetical protein AKJ51_01660 [candidate division MSBL1 archaeon SCGC-AAA382A20]|uniref:Helicase HerA central domain-containing protein n=1 Tax=candidate division MSBL1 archaeon SCGC-AAA382A20 TaxID=1698280 RepID=A0A133VLH3_9EURY|nr:hypothetical protein AKJ51_01660 [candidate division MSBL1 archaeon SCGC-AAA382A20]
MKGDLKGAEKGSKNGRDGGRTLPFPGERDSPSATLDRSDKTVLGRDPQTGEKVTAPADAGVHSLVLGATGTGKSTFLLSQMLQNVYRGDSVVLVDPHGGEGSLSHKFLSHIPKDRWDDVVYINPLTAQKYGKLVKINFLDPGRRGPDPIQEAFIESVEELYPNHRDPEFENIFAYSLMLLFDTERGTPTIEQVMEVASNRKNARWERLQKCTDAEVVRFWREDFRNTDPQLYPPTISKIYRRMNTSFMRPFSRAEYSSVDLYEKLNEGGIIVLEVPKGRITEDVSAFFGSIFLSRLAQFAMERSEIPRDRGRPVHVYVDEAYTFITDVLRQNMRGLRKSGVYFTLCSQDVRGYSDIWSENVLPELTDRTVAFRCGEKTARWAESKFTTWLDRKYHEMREELAKLPNYEFYAAVPAGRSVEVKKAETIDVGLGEQDRDEIITRSLEKYGDMTRARKNLERKGGVTVGSPHLNPPEFFVLHHIDEKEMDREYNIVEELTERKVIKKKNARRAMAKLAERGYIEKNTALPWDRSKEAGRRNEFVYLAEKGEKALYPPIGASRAGGAERISMMCQAMRRLRLREQEIVAPVLLHQRSAQSAAVITNVEVEGRNGETVYPDLMIYLDHEPNAWFGNDAAAVEVDAHPQKKSFILHFEDNRNRIEVPTLLVVPDENSRGLAQKHLKEEGAEIVERIDANSGPREVEVVVVNPENIEHPTAVEAEPDPDKRLYRQVRESCKVNGFMKEYRELVK